MDIKTELIKLGIAFLTGVVVAIQKSLGKIIEDIWSDYREDRKQRKQHKRNIISQLTFDITKGKNMGFGLTTGSKNWNKTVADIAIYDKNMAEKIRKFLNHWKHHANCSVQFDKLGVISMLEEDGNMGEYGPDYLEKLSAELNEEYNEVIDLINKWKK